MCWRSDFRILLQQGGADSGDLTEFLELGDDQGFSLASVLGLMVVLSTIAISVVVLLVLSKSIILRTAASMEATYAAETGIAESIDWLNHEEPVLRAQDDFQRTFSIKDGGAAHAEIERWGAFLSVTSEGGVNGRKATRQAIIADRPGDLFLKALFYSNASHQLVLTGSSSIRGDIVVGPAGVTTGNLKDYTSPIKLPVWGTISRVDTPHLPQVRLNHLRAALSSFEELLSRAPSKESWTESRSILITPTSEPVTAIRALPDSIQTVWVQGDLFLTDSLPRRRKPLYIVVQGQAFLKSSAQLDGLVTVVSRSELTIESGASIDHAILFSRTSVTLEDGAHFSGQVFAPSVFIKDHAHASYPSVILSMPGQDNTKQEVVVSTGAQVEGLVGLLSPNSLDISHKNRIQLMPGSTVTGVLYSETEATLDGTVNGTVMVRDFYFYQPPTEYLGWLRSGVIDRTKLPSGFLIPLGFSEEDHLDILEWL